MTRCTVPLSIVVAIVVLEGFATAGTTGGERAFPMFDKVFYKGKPNTSRNGLVGWNILYRNRIWTS